jgi:hypothetical protein
VNKKKPLSTVKAAHGRHGDSGLEQPYWVAAVAALQNSDTVASGANCCASHQLYNTHLYTHTQHCRTIDTRFDCESSSPALLYTISSIHICIHPVWVISNDQPQTSTSPCYNVYCKPIV